MHAGVPFQDVRRNAASALARLRDTLPDTTTHVAFVCRRGNDSLTAQHLLSSAILEEQRQGEETKSHPSAHITMKNVRGGLQAWSSDVDAAFPIY